MPRHPREIAKEIREKKSADESRSEAYRKAVRSAFQRAANGSPQWFALAGVLDSFDEIDERMEIER